MHSNYDSDGFLHGQRERKSGDRAKESKRERERQDLATGSETGHLVHPARRVYKLSNLVDKSVPGLFFVPSRCTPLPPLSSLLQECTAVYTSLGSRERQLSKSRMRFIKPLLLPES